MRSFFVLILAMLLLGCDQMEFDDISHEYNHENILLQNYISHMDLKIYGISSDTKKNIDYFTVVPPPGIGGTEVISEGELKQGSRIKILKIERCNNCFPFGASKRFVIEIISNPLYKGFLVEIDQDRINLLNNNIYFSKE